ncbi:MAG TPA: DUF1848 domain-containing protein [Candidatus Binataceae bacterium]|nr:DUF1848 domain-containing protein [Candidatus Binataceae bacterium]
MIVSASYKTDIPAFYQRWFLNRLRAGYCKMVNPFNSGQRRTVSLARSDVDGFVFWTKNLGPFLEVLPEVRRRGFPFVIQYSINGYPRALESQVADAKRSVEHMRFVAREYGPRVAVWRYDPIIISSLTPLDFHRRNFAALAKELAGATDEVVVSFMQVYRKTRRNMNRSAAENSFDWHDPGREAKQALVGDLVGVASQYNIRLTVCTQPDLLIDGAGEARCIDARRLMDISRQTFRAQLGGVRQGCGCFESIDIGDYDTCPHGCMYCYAVRDRKAALRRFLAHDPDGEYLFPMPPVRIGKIKQGSLS